MKINKTLSTMCQWLFITCGLLAPMYVRAQEDPAPDGAYTSFSTVYNGKRYYLGVDTLKAKDGTPTDTITWYDHPNYATIWQMGEVHVTAGAYMRTIKSVWMAERVERDRCLALGADKGTYSLLVLKEEALATMWQAAASENESNKYIEGYIYYYSDATGVDVYRYLTYDPLFGFSRVYSSRPTSPYRVSIWDRKTGDDLRFDFRPETHTFGLETEVDTTILPLRARVTFYENVDRFRSRDGRIDVFAREPNVIDNQATLIGYPYYLYMYYEWASNPRTPEQHIHPSGTPEATRTALENDTYNGNSIMKYWGKTVRPKEGKEGSTNPDDYEEVQAWIDTALIHVRNFKFERNEDNTLWHDTMYAIGTSPFDRPEARFLRPEGEPGSDPGEGLYVDHVDSLRVYFHCKGQMYRDAALVVRQTYHEQPFTTLRLSSDPNDYVFEPSVGSHDFTIYARYTSGNTILSANGSVVQTMILEDDELNILSLSENITVEVLNADGTGTPDWLTATIGEGANKNKITANVTENTSEANRVAQIRYRYHFVHSSAEGDEATAERILWITQKGKAATDARIYVFSHKGGATTSDLQPVHEKTYVYYAIPGKELSLPVHYDLWGYYRWFNYENDKDLVYDGAWTWKNEPVNHIADESRNGFMPINPTTDVTSHGRWDFVRNFTVGTQTPIPSIRYPESSDKTGKIACDVSAYTDIDTTGTIGVSLSAMTEPTLSYRQIFDIRPAKEQADKMATCLSGSEGWMEDKTVILPAKRAVTLEQQYPVSDKATGDVEDHLQYIYYHNTTNSSSMGTAESLDATKAASYARIGKSRTDGDEHLEVLDLSSLADGTYTVLMVNPRQTGGYALGYASSSSFNYGEWTGTMSDEATMKTWLQNNVMKQNAYRLTLKKSGSNIEVSRSGSGSITVSREGLFSDRWEMQWQSLHLWANAKTIAWSSLTPSSGTTPSGVTNMVQLHMNYTAIFGIRTLSVNGYLHAKNTSSKNDFHIEDNDATDGDETNKSWVFYKIVSGGTTYNEIPRWYKKASGDANWVCVANGDSTASGYTMLDNGYLEISENVHKNPNETIQYCLKTQHFQLAKFTVVTRDADKEGPSERAIIPVETMLNEYEILFTLTSDNQIFPWDQSEMSFHYPMSYTAIGEEQRVFAGDEPAKGEYAFMRSFRGIDAISGIGTTDYLLCLNAAEKPVQFMNFEFPQMSCSDQQLFFTAELCNPIQNGYNPQITAEMEGYNGSEWIPIYRYVTGELPYDDGKWYQLVMPIDQGSIAGYQKFRFKGYLSGSTESEAYVLIDHARFIAKERPLRIYQNNSTCLESDGIGGHQIDIIARLDYQHGTFPVGTLVAYQYQKWNSSTSSFDALTGRTYSYDESIDGSPNYGLVRVPRRDHVPATTDSIFSLSNLPKNKKFYINEGTAEEPYYTLYFTQTVPAESQDLFRIALAVIPTKETTPNFTTAGCATERLIVVKNPVTHQIDGKSWVSVTREVATAADTLKSPNETYRLSLKLNNVPDGAKEVHCKFDMLRSFEADRDYAAKSVEDKETADAAFLTKYGFSRERLMDMLETFRADDERNPLRLVTNWNDVRPEDFMWSGRTKEEADLIYETLNRLIVTDRVLQIGLDYYDVFLGGGDDVYFYTRALPASGWYVSSSNDTVQLPACNIPQWFEIHSKASAYTLRFGYDNIIDGSYQVPVIRASKSDANNHLKVRIAAITHEATSGVVIGWDSTYIVGSNDPDWNSSKHFRYHQDRIVQDDIFDNYYHVPTEGSDAEIENDPHRYVIFRPVKDQSYIDSLSNTSCDCYNYLTTAETKETMFSVKQADGCNFWHLKNTAGYQTKNDFTLKAGYWYKFKTAFFEANGTIEYNSAGDGECKGHAEFIVAVAPDTVVWAPSHPDEANFWNDDDNWTPIVAGKDLHDCIASIPMSDSKVIIPAPAQENMLPIVDNTVRHEVDDHDYGFEQNTCSEILFYPNATMLGQENLEYNRAFVDVQMLSGNWQTFSPALKYIYTGDMYIPQDTARSSDRDFLPHRFQNDDGTSAGENAWSEDYNRVWPYATYQGFYNTTVQVAYQNTDEDDNPNAYRIKSSADWIETNVLNRPLTPGHAEVIKGYGPSDENGERLVVRLPKQETKYHYILETPLGSGIYAASHDAETMEGKPAWASLTHNLAFDKYSVNPSDTSITVTLTNETVSKVFFFGNPTMALVDVYELCKLNKDQLESGGSANTYKFTAYQLREGASSYTTKIISGPGQFYIAPQRAVGLIATDEVAASKTLSVKLSPRALVAMTGDGSTVTPSLSAPQRRNSPSAAASPYSRYLYISAANRTNDGLSKSYLTLGEENGASRGFRQGEDVLTLNSGLEYYSDCSFSTPMTLFTIADNQPLMYDVRDTVGCVPVVFTTLDDHYTFDNTTVLSFATQGEWDRPLYLYDALTQDSVLIVNGLQIEVETPLSDQLRYFINGLPAPRATDQPGIATGIESVNPQDDLSSDSENGRTFIYDILGRPVMTLGEYDLLHTVQLPTGVYLIRRGATTERRIIR